MKATKSRARSPEMLSLARFWKATRAGGASRPGGGNLGNSRRTYPGDTDEKGDEGRKRKSHVGLVDGDVFFSQAEQLGKRLRAGKGAGPDSAQPGFRREVFSPGPVYRTARRIRLELLRPSEKMISISSEVTGRLILPPWRKR